MLVSVVIPCYNSEASIEKVVEMTIAELNKVKGCQCEFVLVNDCSRDDTFGAIKRLGQKYPFVRGVNLMRNFGQHNAIMAALHYTSGDFVVGMDDDFQTHPSQITILLDKIQEGYDLVYGEYGKKEGSFLKNLSSKFNKVTSRILLGRPKEVVSSNFWVITKAVRDELIKYKNYNPYVDALFYRTTHNIADVPIQHFKRESGVSNYTFRKLVRLWLAYWNYSVIPLRISSVLGMLFAGGGFIAALITVVKKIITPDMPMGWASTICLMMVFFGIVLLVLGIIGEYLGKIILALNSTPQYIVRETVNVEEEEGK